MRIEVVTAATLLPVTVEECMSFARIDETSEAAAVRLALLAAIEKAEAKTGRRPACSCGITRAEQRHSDRWPKKN